MENLQAWEEGMRQEDGGGGGMCQHALTQFSFLRNLYHLFKYITIYTLFTGMLFSHCRLKDFRFFPKMSLNSSSCIFSGIRVFEWNNALITEDPIIEALKHKNQGII